MTEVSADGPLVLAVDVLIDIRVTVTTVIEISGRSFRADAPALTCLYYLSENVRVFCDCFLTSPFTISEHFCIFSVYIVG